MDNEPDLEAQAAEVRALVTEAARIRGTHDPELIHKLLPDSAMITDAHSAKRAVDLVVREYPCMIAELEPPRIYPTPGTPGPHPRFRLRKKGSNEEWLEILQAGLRQ